MKTVKNLLFLSIVVLFTLTSCNKDKEAPAISSISVNGVSATLTSGEASGQHILGSTLEFAVSATDDTELTLFQITEESANSSILDDGNITGTSANFTYTFVVDTAKYSVADEIKLSFLVQDGGGSSDDATYTINVQ